MSIRILEGDCRTMLATLPAASVQCCVTSPPYFGLRNYGHADQIGAETTPDDFVAAMVAVFREVRRALKDDGCLWLNLGDSYSAGGMGPGSGKQLTNVGANVARKICPDGFKPKDLLMIPATVAIALRSDGWYLRSDCIWHKPNPMPESCRDRPTSAHEHVFLLTKSAKYFYDADAVAEPAIHGELFHGAYDKRPGATRERNGRSDAENTTAVRNLRNVWTIPTQGFSGAHFATMAPDLAERCVKAGSRPGDTVLDPFGGAGTTAMVADRLKRNAILIELNPEYAEIARNRISDDAGMFAEVA